MPVPGRMKRLESVISICLLAVLIIIGVGVFLKQSKYDVSQYPSSLRYAETSRQQSDISQSPNSDGLTPAGYEMLSKAESYNADNLYEKIDGKAPLYLEAGFKELSTQRFVSTSDKGLWMELYIYDMANIKNAFSVYSEQRRAEAEVFPSMQFAYKSGNALYFVHGKYYIEIVGASESGELSKAIAEAAQKIEANLAIDPNAGIAELSFFPQENLVPGSFKLYVVNAFGCEKLTDVFTARYQLGNETITAFISKKADSKEAEATAESYRNFLTENGAVIKNTDNKTLVGKVMDSYGTTEIVFTAGPFVAGIHEAEDQQAAEKMAEVLISRLNSLNKDLTAESAKTAEKKNGFLLSQE
ncbi:MAG: DUF6599 family protein [Sedimentisphaerales bacterium]